MLCDSWVDPLIFLMNENNIFVYRLQLKLLVDSEEIEKFQNTDYC